MNEASRRRTLRLLSNGIYVVTSAYGGRHGGATVTWLSQASFEPPLIMAAIRPESNVFKCLSQSRVAAIHILASDQKDVAQRFFGTTRVVGDRMNGEPFAPGMTDAPILQSALAYMECVVRHIVGQGDHAVVVMEVVEAECRGDLSPLTVAGSPWQYGG
jgi:flavin reductase (DIM6/NTAB) family NADH-FMN oxidoreductase RutF